MNHFGRCEHSIFCLPYLPITASTNTTSPSCSAVPASYGASARAAPPGGSPRCAAVAAAHHSAVTRASRTSAPMPAQ